MDYKSIGRRIRECREARGLKREALAEMTELSVSYLSALERGEKLPKLDTFIRIANTLEVTSDTLLAGVLCVENRIVTSQLSERLAALEVSQQRKILNVVKTMLEDAMN